MFGVLKLGKLGASMKKAGLNPRTLFSASEPGAWYDPSDMSTLFQDSAGTVPVTAVEQPVGLMLDKSGRGNHASQATTTKRPVLKIDAGGFYYLGFDGVDDALQTGNIDFTATDKMTVFAGVRKLSDAAVGSIIELSATPTAADTTTRFFVSASYGNVASYGLGMTSNNGASGTYHIRALTYTAPITNVVVALFDSSLSSGPSRAIPRVNAAAPGTIEVNFQQLGSAPVKFGSFPIFIGCRGGTTLPFNGRLYGLIVRGAQTDSLHLTNVERFLAHKSGVVL